MFTTLIEPIEVYAHLSDQQWVIVDCRFDLADVNAGSRAYQQSHIPHAVYAHLDHDLSSSPITDQGRHPLPSPAALTQLFSRLGIDEKKQVVVYDHLSGAYAARLWWMLGYMGHPTVAVLNGGWQAWLAAGYPVEMGHHSNPPALFVGEPHRQWLVQIDEVAQAKRLIDSREEGRYRGEYEPIDARAGHIPAAVNYFFKHNLAADGRFLPASQIRAQLQAVQGDVLPEETVYYCGSGVTACMNLLAQQVAGMNAGKLYVGSWSEWSKLRSD